MKSRTVHFPGSGGTRLAGVLDLPEDEHPLACAVFAHCFTCSKNFKVAVHIAQALCREKLAVLRFDFAGLGESGGAFADSSFSSNVGDLVAAAEFLAASHPLPLLLVGHSLGGAAVLAAAPKIPAVRAVVTLAAPYDPAHVGDQLGEDRARVERQGEAQVEIAGRPFVLRRQFLEDLAQQQPAAIIGQLHKPLLIMHSPADTTVGIDNAARIYRAARHPKSFISLDGADHLLSDRADSEYAGQLIASWAKRYLPARPPGIETDVIDSRVTARTAANGFYTELFAGGHALVADEPRRQGGTERGPTPYDYLLAALGACTGMTLQLYARRKHWPLDAAVVRLRHAKVHAEDCRNCDDEDARVDRFEREIELRGQLSEEQQQRLLEIAERCPVHRTLHAEVDIRTRLRDNSSREA